MRALRIVLIASVLAMAAPAAASAAQPHVLRDVAPFATTFKDRVIHSGGAASARSATTANWAAYRAPDGVTVLAAISSHYGARISSAVAQSYVDFLDSLAHGPELSTLRIYIAPPDEVTAQCGGQDGTLACYDASTKIIVVPGENTDTGSAGVTTSYVVAHEYGHHIAASRSNAPFNAFQYGPKYWSSYEFVCHRASAGELAPGDEAARYRSNPGEGWAETYAQLKYPDVGWQFNSIMKPDAGAFAAAQRDVVQPWTANGTKVFKGTFSRSGSTTKRFSFDLTLDGQLRATLHGPSRSNYNLVLSSNGRSEGRTSARGSRDALSYEAACRTTPVERVTVAVKRVAGAGPFTVRLSYAG